MKRFARRFAPIDEPAPDPSSQGWERTSGITNPGPVPCSFAARCSRHRRRFFILVGLPAFFLLLGCPPKPKPTPEPPAAEDQRLWPSEASATAQDSRSAILAIQTEQLDTVALIFPAGSIPAATPVSLRTVTKPNLSVDPKRVLGAFEIDARGVSVTKPGFLSITRPAKQALSPTARFYFLISDNKMILLPEQGISGQTLTARLYHASSVIWADPTLEELRKMITDPSLTPPDAASTDSSFMQWVKNSEAAAAQAQLLGDDALADAIQKRVADAVGQRLDDGVKHLNSTGCDPHTPGLMQLLEIGQQLGIPDSTSDAVVQAITDNARSCLRNARVEYAFEFVAPPLNCSTSFGPPVSLMKLDNGQLVGNGQEQLQVLCTFAINERLTADVLLTTLKFQRSFRDFVQDITADGSGGDGGTQRIIEAHLAEDSIGKVSGHVRAGALSQGLPFLNADVESSTLCGGGGTATVLFVGQLLLKKTTPETGSPQSGNPFTDCIDPFANMAFLVEDGATFVKQQTAEGAVAVWTTTLHFDVDQCDQEKMAAQCDQEAKEMIRACRSLNDWEVVEQIGTDSEPQVSCGSSDCTEVIHRNEARGKGPFTSITKSLDKACGDKTPIVCHLECYGWPSSP